MDFSCRFGLLVILLGLATATMPTTVVHAQVSLLAVTSDGSTGNAGNASSPSAPPQWPGKNDKKAWPTGSNLTDAQIEDVLKNFVGLVVAELGADKAPEREITFEALMSELCERWVSETPYETNSHGYRTVTDGAKAIFIRENNYQRVIRSGWGICGDHQTLLLHLVDLALQEPALAHLRPQRSRVQDLSVAAYGRLEIPALGPNHGAVGLVSTDAYQNKVKSGKYLRNGSEAMRWDLLGPMDVLVYDIWARPPIVGTKNADLWGSDYVTFNFKSVVGLAQKKYELNFGSLKGWTIEY